MRRIVCEKVGVARKIYTRKDYLSFESLEVEVCQLVHVLREEASRRAPKKTKVLDCVYNWLSQMCNIRVFVT